MALSIDHLSLYLQTAPLILDGITWNTGSCITVVSYVIKFSSCELSDIITRLEFFASKDIGGQFTEMFVKVFIPKVESFFIVPTQTQLCDNDKHLKRNEVLAGFMDFLRRILKHEATVPWSGGRHEGRKECDLLKREFTFFIAIVEDTLFQCTHNNKLQEQVNCTLNELEILANETGNFIYSCVFSYPPVSARRFCLVLNALVERVRIFNLNIRRRYIRFQELTMLNVTSRPGLVGSFFIVDSLIEDLGNITKDQVIQRRSNCILDFEIKGQIETLARNFKHFRKVTKVPRAQDIVLKELLLHIKDLAYEAEYLIHSHVAKNTPPWYLSSRLPAVLHKSQLICERLMKMQDDEAIKGSSEASTSQPVGPVTAEDYCLSSGFEDEKTKILSDLTGGPINRTLISIYGMPGLGKTTMAGELYNSRTVRNHFDRRVWCVVSQTYSERDLMIHILMNVAHEPKEDTILSYKDEVLRGEIHKALMGWRYLIVLDDVWQINELSVLLKYFPQDKGSRIIITSRIKAAESPINCDTIFHTLPTLSEDQCWDLLRKKVFHKDLCPQELISTGKRIAAKCHGIPLTVVVIAGILVNLERTESVWEKVEKNLSTYLANDQNNYVKVLDLSYAYLPHNLRPCFLYLGAFREDTEIPVKKLVWLWTAEGFIPRSEDNSQEEIAETYISDLINRSLLLASERRSDSGIKACRVHDLLRDLCIRKAHEENFMKSTNYGFSIYENHQRLYVPPSTSRFHWRPLSSHVRSFRGCITHHQNYLSKMALFRVLDSMPEVAGCQKINGAQNYFQQMPETPVYLRYLGINQMPERSISYKLASLEFLCIENQKNVCIPPEVLQMVTLRHLVIKKVAEFKDCNRSKPTNNLISLSFVGIHKDEDEEVLKDSHLQQIKCLCGGRREFPVLSSLAKLKSLKVVFQYSPQRTILSESNFPSTIKKLHISKSAFPWEKLSVIGKLPHLHVLKLGPDAFSGKLWETVDGQFENLIFLKVELPSLKKWITSSSDHFPRLERLVVSRCYYLLAIPNEVGSIDTLQRIEVSECGEGAYMSALEIEEEQHDYGNEELQVLITSSKWTNEQLGHKYREWKEAKTLEEDGTEE